MYRARIFKIMIVSILIFAIIIGFDVQGYRSTGKIFEALIFSCVPYGWYVLNNIIAFLLNYQNTSIMGSSNIIISLLSFVIKFSLCLLVGWIIAPVLITHWIFKIRTHETVFD